MNAQQKRAERLRSLHHRDKLLVLPNIWDVLGAKLLESEGFEAIATASASVAFSRGYNDNEEIAFSDLLVLFKSICERTALPVTTDIERGYADSLPTLRENIRKLIQAGVVGLNIEDSAANGQSMESIEQQCDKIREIRKVADEMGVPLVINARTDVFIPNRFDGNSLDEAINRGNQYKDAGADCFYPILCNMDELVEINSKVALPLNVLAQPHVPESSTLEKFGIARLSLGPALLKSALTQMRSVVRSLKQGEACNAFMDDQMIESPHIVAMLKS